MKHKNEITPFPIFFAGIIAGAFLWELIIALGYKGGYDIFKDQGSSIAAFVTLGAIWGAWVAHKNDLQFQNDRYQENFVRKAKSLRAEMSDALMELITYTHKCYKFLETDLTGQFPETPKSAIAIFKQAIEFSDSVTANQIEDMTIAYQICNSRLHSLQKYESFPNYRVRDFTFLNVMFNRFIEYARKDVEVVAYKDFTDEEIAYGLRNLLGNDIFLMQDDYMTVRQEITNYANRIENKNSFRSYL